MANLQGNLIPISKQIEQVARIKLVQPERLLQGAVWQIINISSSQISINNENKNIIRQQELEKAEQI